MAIEGEEPVAEPSLRESLEAAIEVVETPAQESTPSQPAEPQQAGTEPSEAQVVDLNKQPTTGKGAPAPDLYETAPKSWKAGAQNKWSSVDPEIRAEVHRREKETSKVFGETNQIRERVKQFDEAFRPYEARIRTTGMTPVQVIENLMQADHVLTSSPPIQRAQFMAKLIKDYGVDIRALDDALSGQGTQQVDPVMSQVDRLLAERLSPLQAFLSQQQQVAQYQEQQIQAEAATTVDQMSQDNVKFPHFDIVREDMADVIEMNARRNVFLTPEQAYQRSVAMNPELGAQMVQQANNGRQLQQARNVNDRAQRALAASSSVSGAPGGSPVGGVDSKGSLRDTIEAAFNQVAGR